MTTGWPRMPKLTPESWSRVRLSGLMNSSVGNQQISPAVRPVTCFMAVIITMKLSEDGRHCEKSHIFIYERKQYQKAKKGGRGRRSQRKGMKVNANSQRVVDCSIGCSESKMLGKRMCSTDRTDSIVQNVSNDESWLRRGRSHLDNLSQRSQWKGVEGPSGLPSPW